MRFTWPVAVVLLVSACDGGSTDPSPDTWPLVRDRILAPNCAGACHAPGTSFAAQSGLVLTPDEAWSQLVDAAPTNTAAREAGLLRVNGSPGADLHDHFLWEKVYAPAASHLREDHPGFGSPMPLGRPPLTYGELSVIQAWLEAGAPETGVVIDEIALADTSRFREGDFVPLPMLAPDDGWSIRLGPFDVPPRFEREFFYFEPAPDASEHLVDRVEISMRSGSHHFIVYGYPDGPPTGGYPASETYRDLRNRDGSLAGGVLVDMRDHVFYTGTQWPRMDYSFPDGVALRIPAGMGFDLNAHNVNASDGTRTGEVHVNVHWADPAAVRHTAEVLNLNNLGLSLPPNRETTVSESWVFSERRHVFQLFSHAHRRMTRFDVYIVGGSRDGERIYRATDWEHPPILEIDPPMVLEPGQGLRLETTYFNESSRTVRFGFLSEDEMQILFGYYYTD